MLTQAHTPSLTHLLTHSTTHPPTHPLILHSLTHSLTKQGLAKLHYIDITAIEAARMFDSLTHIESECSSEGVSDTKSRATLSTIKSSNDRTLLPHMLEAGVARWTWLRSLLKVFSAFRNSTFSIPESYDYTQST